MKKEYFSLLLWLLKIASRIAIPPLLYFLFWISKVLFVTATAIGYAIVPLICFALLLFYFIISLYISNLKLKDFIHELVNWYFYPFINWKKAAFIIGFDTNTLYLKEAKVTVSDIHELQLDNIGSEPYIIVKNKVRIDIPISWLSRKDKQVVKEQLLEFLST